MAKESTFNPEYQAANTANTASKVVVALERLSEAFRVLLWLEAKEHGLSPIQVQILTFLLHYPDKMKTVTHLASDFNMTKATISDAIKTLESKELLKRKADTYDNRSHILLLTKEGKNIAKKVEKFAQPMQGSVNGMPPEKQGVLLEQLMNLIQDLNQNLITTPQRMCFNCRFHEKKSKAHYCQFFKINMKTGDLRIDCMAFESK